MREKYIFVGYFEDVKGYRLIQPNSKNIIIRREVKFDENISAYKASLVDVLPLSTSFASENIPSSNRGSENENPSPPSQDLPLARQLPK